MAAVVGTVPAVVKDTNGGVTAVTMPTHRAGDLLVIGVVSRTTTAITGDNGFVVVFEGSTTNPHCALLAKVAASAAETCNITAGADDDIIQAGRVAYHGVRAGSEATDIVKGTEATATSGTFDPPNVAFGSTTDGLVLVLAGFAWTNAADAISAGPTGFTTIRNDKSAASTTSVGLYMGWLDDPAASSRNPGTGSNTSRVWRANTFFIPPASYTSWSDDFTAGNGSLTGYNGWVGSAQGGAATYLIQSNQAQFVSGTSAAQAGRGLQALPNSDGIWYYEHTYPNPVQGGNELVLCTRAAGNWNNSGYSDDTSYSFETAATYCNVYRNTDGTLLQTAAISPGNGTTWASRIVVLGSTLRSKSWDIAGAEPAGGWQIETTDATTASGGYIQVRGGHDGSGGAVTDLLDNLTFIDLTGPNRLPQPRAVLQAVHRAGTW